MLVNDHYMELETVPNPDGGLIPNPKYKKNSDFYTKSDYDRDAPKVDKKEDVSLDSDALPQIQPVIERDVSPKLGLPTMNMPVPENFDYSFDVPGEVHEVSATKENRRAARNSVGSDIDISNPVLDSNIFVKNLGNSCEVKSV